MSSWPPLQRTDGPTYEPSNAEVLNHPIWLLCNRIDEVLRAVRDCPDLNSAIDQADAATWITAEIRGHVAKLTSAAQPPVVSAPPAQAPTDDEAL